MPCSDHGRGESELQERCDRATRLLCKLLTNLSGHERFFKLVLEDNELRAWWDEHQAFDRERIKVELYRDAQARLRRNGLEKLTPDERAALGIK